MLSFALNFINISSNLIAQVNFGFNSASILGIFLAVAGAGLFFLRSIRPEISRDHDIFFAAIGLLCGVILLWHGWRLDPILQFGQLLLAGTATFFAVETIRLRGITTEQAKYNNGPIVDDERRVSKVYRAELDRLEPYDGEDEYENPRLKGYPDKSYNRNSSSGRETPRSRRVRRSSEGYSQNYDRNNVPPSRRRSSNKSRRSAYDDRDMIPDHWEEEESRSRRDAYSRDSYSGNAYSRDGYSGDNYSEDSYSRDSYSGTTSYNDVPPQRTKKRRRRPPVEGRVKPRREDGSRRSQDDISTDYVDYQPVDNYDETNESPSVSPRPIPKPSRKSSKPRNEDDNTPLDQGSQEDNDRSPINFDY